MTTGLLGHRRRGDLRFTLVGLLVGLPESACGTSDSAAGRRSRPGTGGRQASPGTADATKQRLRANDHRRRPERGVSAPGFTMLNISKAWQYSTGNGVPVAVIDTGINPSRRLPVVAGGDYIMGGDGLMDCDAHGTIVASLIGAAPQGTPMPAPMPPSRRFRRRRDRRPPARHHRRAGRHPPGATATALAGNDH